MKPIRYRRVGFLDDQEACQIAGNTKAALGLTPGRPTKPTIVLPGRPYALVAAPAVVRYRAGLCIHYQCYFLHNEFITRD